MKIAIVGNPNCGKTTIFNALTGAKQKVGNWAGVTVDKKSGNIQLNGKSSEIIDLPGLYSMVGSDANALDEQIASKFIIEEKPDLIINVIDASNFERNLFLTMQLIEMKVPVILAINMIDVAKKKGLVIDFDKLEKTIGTQVVPMIGRKSIGIRELKLAMEAKVNTSSFDIYSYYPQVAINEIKGILKENDDLNDAVNPNWLAIRLAKGDIYAQTLVSSKSNELIKIYIISQELNLNIEIPAGRYQAISFIAGVTCNTQKIIKHKLTELIDSVCMNRFLGLPIFLFIMYLMFEFAITIGGALQPLFDDTSKVIFVDGLMHLGIQMGLPFWLTAVVSQGVGLGLNTVMSFIPQIGCMFLFLSFLEDSGYMARAAFVMDRLMQYIGLPGKSFVPLIVGFGCNVPAVMATRTLETRRDRLLTIMMSPFISCGARLAIFAVFAAAFFPQGGALIVFLLYIIGIIGAIITGLVVKSTLLKGNNAPFIMEIPVYHLPNAKTILLHTWDRLKRFIFRAGKVIIPICLVIGTLNSIQVNGNISIDGSRSSLLSEVGKTMTPIFEPMGVKQDNWPATVGLLTGVLAKEVVVGTLNTLYTQGQQENLESENKNLNFKQELSSAAYQTIINFKNMSWSSFANPFTANEADGHMDRPTMGTMVTSFGSTSAAFAYLLFVLLYVPCVATIGAMAREGGKGWAWLSVLWSTALAYGAAVIVYQFSQIFNAPLTASLEIAVTISILTGVIYGMHYASKKIRFNPKNTMNCNSNCISSKSCH
jgi:ferrous iron transport protein B